VQLQSNLLESIAEPLMFGELYQFLIVDALFFQPSNILKQKANFILFFKKFKGLPDNQLGQLILKLMIKLNNYQNQLFSQ
jgi:hypothetical protein